MNINEISDEELNNLKLNILKEENKRKNNDKEYIPITSIEELVKLVKNNHQLYYKLLNKYWKVDYANVVYYNPSRGRYMVSFGAGHMSNQVDENYGCWSCNMAGGGRNNIWSGYYMFIKNK